MLDFFARLCGDVAGHLSDHAHIIRGKHDHVQNGWVDQDERGQWHAIGATDDRAHIFTASGATSDEAFAAWYAQYKAHYGVASFADDGTPRYELPSHWSNSEYTPEAVYGERGGAWLRQFWAEHDRSEP